MINPETATPKIVVKQMELYLGLNEPLHSSTLKEEKMKILDRLGLPRISSEVENYLVWHPDQFNDIPITLSHALANNMFAVLRLTTEETSSRPGNLFASQLNGIDDLPNSDQSDDLVFTSLEDDDVKLSLSDTVKVEAFIGNHAQKIKIEGRDGKFNLGGGFNITLEDFEEKDDKSYVILTVEATLNDFSPRLLGRTTTPQISSLVKLEINKNGTIVFPEKEENIELEKQFTEEEIACLILSQVINDNKDKATAVSKLFSAMAFTYPTTSGNSIGGVYKTQDGKIIGGFTDFDTADMVTDLAEGMSFSKNNLQIEKLNLKIEWLKEKQNKFYQRFLASPLAKLAHVTRAELNYRKENI